MSQSSKSSKFVPYWQTNLDETETDRVCKAIRAGNLSMGAVTEEFEKKLGEMLGVPYVVLAPSGSAALFMAVWAAGIRQGDEVILPNRTFVATANAVLLAGGKVTLVDTKKDSSIVDEAQIESAITKKTKAIVAVHLNGSPVDMAVVRRIAQAHGLKVIEDAAQALCSRNAAGFLGTQSDLGCFSLGVTKFITTGQGGFVVTRDKALHDQLQRFRSHGVLSTFATTYDTFGFNFKYNDVLASIGLAQLTRAPEKRKAHSRVYRFYEEALRDIPYLELLPVDESKGTLPLWVEVLCKERDRLRTVLDERQIQTRPFLPDLSSSAYLGNDDARFKNSRRFARDGLFMPCGPGLPQESLDRTIEVLHELKNDHFPPYRGILKS